MVGGSQLIRIMIGIVSTKFAAIFIGPAGVGLIGAYQSITRLGIKLSGLGINQSGVRDVAVIAGKGDEQAIARTVFILRRMCWLTGLVGAAGLAILAVPISNLTFGNSDHAVGLILLSLVVLVTAVAQGQMAVIQGLRRIADLVRVQIFGSLAGAIVSISLYATIGMSGIVPALLAIALFNLWAAWWFSRKIFTTSVFMNWPEIFAGAKSLVGLGTALMVGGLFSSFTAYAARALIARNIGMDGLGIYQAAFAISGYVFNFVLGAMGTDFYPRLAGVSDSHEEMTRLVNEQTEIGLILATPALVAILGLAPLVIDILYSARFAPAVELLRWFVMGCFLRVIAWPLGLVQLAKGEKHWFVGSQLVFNALHLFFIFAGVSIFGLLGTAIAFFAMYIGYTLGVRLIAWHLIGFSWSKATKRLIITQVSLVVVVFIVALILSKLWSMTLGSMIFVVVGVYCLRLLLVRLEEGHRACRMVRKLFGEKLLRIIMTERLQKK